MKARIIPNFYRIQHQPAGQQFFNNILKKPVVYFDNASDIAKAIKPTNNNLDNIKNKIAENKVGGNTNKVKDMIAAKKTATMPPVKKEEPKINISTNNENKNKMNDFINNYRKEQANKTSGNNSSTETHVDNGVLNKPDSGDSTNGQNNTNSESTNNTTDSSTNNTQGEQQNSQQQATQPQTDNQQGEESGDFRDSEYYKNGKEIVLGEVKKDRTISEKAGKEEADELNKSAKNYKEGTLDADGLARKAMIISGAGMAYKTLAPMIQQAVSRGAKVDESKVQAIVQKMQAEGKSEEEIRSAVSQYLQAAFFSYAQGFHKYY